MKKIKRFAALLLAGVLALAVLTGCGGQTNADLSDQLAQKATEAYAKAIGVKAEEAQLDKEAAAFNKAALDMIGEDGVMVLNKGDENIEDVGIGNSDMTILHKTESYESTRYRMSATFVLLGGETTREETRIFAPVATLKAEQVNAILSGDLSGLKVETFNGLSERAEIKGVGVSAKKLKDGTYCFVLTVDMVE